MKFEKYPVTVDRHGFKFAKNDIMVGNAEKICLMCGTPTKYIEVISEAHFCSDECVSKFYEVLSSVAGDG